MGYFERALLAAIVIGAGAGFVGCLVVLRRRTFFAQALTHGTYPGAVAAAALGVSVPLGAAAASVVLVRGDDGHRPRARQGAQVAAGIVLTGGFAAGALLAGGRSRASRCGPSRCSSGRSSRSPTPTSCSRHPSRVVAVVARRRLRQGDRLLDLRPGRTSAPRATASGRSSCSCSALTAATVVSALPAVGAILAIALIAAPAAAARLVVPTYRGMLVAAPVIGAASGVLGVLASRAFAVAAGPGDRARRHGVLRCSRWASPSFADYR